jgi:hypothetical protein
MSSTLTRWRSGVYEPNINQRTKVCQFVYVWIEHVTGKLPKMATVQSFSFRFLPFCFHVPRLLPRPERWTLNPQLHLLNEMLPRAWPKFHDYPKVLTPTRMLHGYPTNDVQLVLCLIDLSRPNILASLAFRHAMPLQLYLQPGSSMITTAWAMIGGLIPGQQATTMRCTVYGDYKGEGLVRKMKVLTFGRS